MNNYLFTRQFVFYFIFSHKASVVENCFSNSLSMFIIILSTFFYIIKFIEFSIIINYYFISKRFRCVFLILSKIILFSCRPLKPSSLSVFSSYTIINLRFTHIIFFTCLSYRSIFIKIITI